MISITFEIAKRVLLRAGQILERDVRTEDIEAVISDTFAASLVDMLGNTAI
jgi:hypothetical protein